MSYATLARLQQRLSISTDSDDLLLQMSLDWADALINNACDRRFTAATATRYFGPDRVDWEGSERSGPDRLSVGLPALQTPLPRR
jgi:hypothetical protein